MSEEVKHPNFTKLDELIAEGKARNWQDGPDMITVAEAEAKILDELPSITRIQLVPTNGKDKIICAGCGKYRFTDILIIGSVAHDLCYDCLKCVALVTRGRA